MPSFGIEHCEIPLLFFMLFFLGVRVRTFSPIGLLPLLEVVCVGLCFRWCASASASGGVRRPLLQVVCVIGTLLEHELLQAERRICVCAPFLFSLLLSIDCRAGSYSIVCHI